MPATPPRRGSLGFSRLSSCLSVSGNGGCRGQLVHVVELGLPLIAQVVADEDQGQIGVGQQALLDDVGVLLIQSAGALVHQQDTPVVDQRAGDGHTLLLPARQGAAFFAHGGVQPLEHIGQVPGQGAVPQGLGHLLVAERLAQSDVLPDGGVEEEDVLLDVAHLLLELLGGVLPHIAAVKGHIWP